MKDLLRKAGREDVVVESAALHTDEIGNDIHYGTRQKLTEKKIPFAPRQAWLLTAAKAHEYDLLIGMDAYNIADLKRLVYPEDRGKIRKLLEFAGSPRDVADPWYTGNFDATWDDVLAGCTALLKEVDSRAGTTRRAFIGGLTAFAILKGASGATGKVIKAVYENGTRATDFLQCRRLYLDICGRIPTPAEVRAYLASKKHDKYEALVDALLQSEDYADYWAMRYCDILRVKSEFPINLWPNAVYVYHRRIRKSIADDEPWPDFARSLLCARGSNFRVPETNFLRATADKTPAGLSETASMTFLMEPTGKYAKYFSRVGFKPTKEWKEELVYLKDGPAELVPEAFMDELEGPLQSAFYAVPAKRVYYWIFNAMPRPTALGEFKSAFARGGYRLRPLLRHAFLSSAYRAGPIRGKFPARRLDAEVLEDALCSITGACRAYESIAPEPFSFLPPNRKSVLIEDGSITNAFMLCFGRPARDTGALEERKNDITVNQRLYLYNSSKLWNDICRMTAAKAFAEKSHAEQVEDLYLKFLSRSPVKDELEIIDPGGKGDVRNIAWHLMNSFEFLYRI